MDERYLFLNAPRELPIMYVTYIHISFQKKSMDDAHRNKINMET